MHEHKQKKVIIMGAGIGGLACAHELSKDPNYDITVIERWGTVGGLARINPISVEDESSSPLYSEYCWKAISYSYVYLLQIMQEIGVLENLLPLRTFLYDNGTLEYGNSFVTELDLLRSGLLSFGATWGDIAKLAILYLYVKALPESFAQTYDSIPWNDYAHFLSPVARRWLVDSTAIYLGMDYKKISTYTIFRFIRAPRVVSNLVNPNFRFYSLNGRMDTHFLDIWRDHLIKAGVNFVLNKEITSVMTATKHYVTTQDVTATYIRDYDVYSADILVNAMDVGSLAKLFPKYNTLAAIGTYVQCQVMIRFPSVVMGESIMEKWAEAHGITLSQSSIFSKRGGIGRELRGAVYICANSPWFLMARYEASLWTKGNGPLSIGIGIWDVKGLNNKTALECTREELAKECWMQFVGKCSELAAQEMPEYDIWNTVFYHPQRKTLDTIEPKFSNNAGTYHLRPEIYEADTKLYHATAYAKTNMDIYNMESAAEAGTRAAQLIIAHHK